jgi:hypothetical protein
MPLEPSDWSGGANRDREETLTLLDLASSESVRLVEALPAALANDLRERADDAEVDWSRAACPPTGLCEDGRAIDEFGSRLGLCRRIARRALRGSLADPTRGANAFHHIEASPDWARRLLPVAVYGPYLFYRR